MFYFEKVNLSAIIFLMFELSMSVNSNEGADIEVAYLAG
jgi:hypothetical protein